MSDKAPEHQHESPPEGTDDEKNLAQLLTRAHRPPRIAPDARKRILERLVLSRRRTDPAGGTVATLARRFGARPRVVVASLALAAALLLVVGVSLRGGAVVHKNEGPAPTRFSLADGTEVTLDRGAEVVEDGARGLRLVRGSVMLDVAHADRPFVVESRQGRAVALGTRFAVSVKDDETRAAVARGTVRLEAGAGRELLHAGEEGVLAGGSAPLRRAAPRLSYLTSWAREAPATRDAAAPPVRRGALVARDPQWGRDWPLAMRELAVDVHVEDGVARTTLDQTFFNHVNRDLEGVYSLALPPDASISRLAMYVDGNLVEGGIVPRERGRDVYESIVYRRRDPALLEWMAGNLFRVRVFPLPARSEKRLLLSYTQPLERLYDTTRISVPMPRLDAPVGRMTLKVRIVGGEAFEIAAGLPVQVAAEGSDRIVTFRGEAQELGDELALTLRAKADHGAEVARFHDAHGDYLRARVLPDLAGAARAPRSRRWVVLFDTSASRDEGDLGAQQLVLGRLLREWDEDDRFAVIAFDATRRVLPGGFRRVGDTDPREIAKLCAAETTEGVGATDLEAALRDAVRMLDGEDRGAEPHILYLGDGIATAGQSGARELGEIVRGHATFIGVAIGARADATLLRALAEGSGGMFASMSPGEDLGWRAFDLVAALNTPRVLGVEARVADAAGRPLEGATVLLASTQAAAGEPIDALAKVDRTAAKLLLSGTLEGKPWSQEVGLDAGSGAARYLPRLWAKRRVDGLVRDGAESHRDEISRLGLDHFLITPYTSLLVLENDAMYARFEVQRGGDDDWARYPAPKTIPVRYEPEGAGGLALEPGGAVILRTPIDVFAAPQAPSFSEGRLGSVRVRMGAAAGGFGSGHGRLGGAHRPGFDSDSLVVNAADDVSRSAVTTITTAELRQKQSAGWFVDLAGASAAPAAPSASVSLSAAQVSVSRSGVVRVDFGGTKSQGQTMNELEKLGGSMFHTMRKNSALGTYGAPVQPVALHSSRDPRLDDLTEFVPALFGDEIDRERERIAALTVDKKRGCMSEPARELYTRALARRAPERWTLAGGGALEVDREGHFQSEGTTATGLSERVVYDGRVLSSLYPEIGLVVRRPVGGAELELLARRAPFVLPSADTVTLGHDVVVVGERTFRLTPVSTDPAAELPVIEIDLDGDLRVAKIRRSLDGKVWSETRLERAGDRLTVRTGQAAVELTRTAPGTTGFDATLPMGSIEVEVPSREPAFWSAKAAALEPGSPAWRAAERQLLAAYAALGQGPELWATLSGIRARAGAVTRGEAVLASRGAREAPNDAALAGALGALGDDDPIARYLRAVRSFARESSARKLEALARPAEPPARFVQLLAAYRALLNAIESDRRRDAVTRYDAFVAQGGYAPLRIVAASMIDSRWGYDDPKTSARIWTDAAAGDPSLAGVTAAGAGRALFRGGLYDEAAQRLERAFDESRRAGEQPRVDSMLRQALFSSRRGEAGWRLFWARYRASVLGSGDPEALLSLLDSLLENGERDDAGAVVGALRAVRVDDPEVASAIVGDLIQLGRASDAWPILRPLLDGSRSDAELLELASTVAEGEGHARDAARYLERSMDAREGMELGVLRGLSARLFGLSVRAASEGGDRVDLAAPLAVAARWRRVDPDNADIDRLCAGALFTAGQPELAKRYLSSIVERHPAEGDAYADVAGVLERQGRLSDADVAWRRATDVEPTNPTWLLRRGQNLLASGDEARGRELLARVAEGRWQDRFSNVVSQAKRMVELTSP